MTRRHPCAIPGCDRQRAYHWHAICYQCFEALQGQPRLREAISAAKKFKFTKELRARCSEAAIILGFRKASPRQKAAMPAPLPRGARAWWND